MQLFGHTLLCLNLPLSPPPPPRRAQSGQAASESYQAEVPHWGEASVHTHIHHPGEVFLECHALGIEMHPLGRVESMDALNPAEMVLLRTLREHAVWCLDAMAAIGGAEG